MVFRFHVLVATIGRKSIYTLLSSICSQLLATDYITIVYDAKDIENTKPMVKQMLTQFKCTTNVITETKTLGCLGKAIRGKYVDLPGDFIMHADDDDTYTPNAMNIVRKHCVDINIVYIFALKRFEEHKERVVFAEKIKYCQISTQSGVIPTKWNKRGKWGKERGGDFLFYKDLEHKKAKFKFVNEIIYNLYPSMIRDARNMKTYVRMTQRNSIHHSNLAVPSRLPAILYFKGGQMNITLEDYKKNELIRREKLK